MVITMVTLTMMMVIMVVTDGCNDDYNGHCDVVMIVKMMLVMMTRVQVHVKLKIQSSVFLFVSL